MRYFAVALLLIVASGANAHQVVTSNGNPVGFVSLWAIAVSLILLIFFVCCFATFLFDIEDENKKAKRLARSKRSSYD